MLIERVLPEKYLKVSKSLGMVATIDPAQEK
jgi:hypothetical protein